ncbi:hypothetical protein QEV69_07030 [Trueperella pyogenes]|uniref:Uncharacterized protein n=1 Tax=Trueperella pyogenes TaxID=1661 RepID=X4RBV8_9ACTO|nr:hypothetical protein [Trueperella pyogenes]AHU89270.1 hypothetical protein CQ11_03935 [Trueperella pyogenes]AJC69341.1 hypothetical protein X956_03855 [Trueperella pyogenes TP8]ALD73997.1 hypothetical protein AN946_06355 [Trueperella pyogenes]AWA43220.1 hypothetical protein DBV13_03910 [Trueperella pyogenes]AWG04378.1 hypothetical protein DC090_08010 [Trueperella pyogenes]
MTIHFFKTISRLLWPAQELDEGGDVPGWVMITLMTAALVVLIWAVAGPALTDLFKNAIDRLLTI